MTKIIIAIPSFQEKYQKILGHRQADCSVMVKMLRAVPLETVSMDFIFAMPGQTFGDLRPDMDTAFENGANHVAIYPFIDFTFTSRTVTAMDRAGKRRLLDEITDYCLEWGVGRALIWTFTGAAEAGYSSMTRDNTFWGSGARPPPVLETV